MSNQPRPPIAPLITTIQLAEMLSCDSPPILLDVRLASDFDSGHIPGAVNNCVFEVAFMKRLADILNDKASPICVYGSGSTSHESRMAAEKLILEGYPKVSELREGLEGWIMAGKEVEQGPALAEPPGLPDGKRTFNLEESRVEWTGRNLLNKHHGTIGLKSGELRFQDGKLKSALITLDMNDIRCSDLEGSEMHDVLTTHLKDHDFFHSDLHPEAIVEIKDTRPIPGAGHGACNLQLRGNLTLKGITKAIEFKAATGVTEDGHFAAQAAFPLDRTEWGIIYGSGKYFKRLMGHLVNDEVDIQLRIVSA